MPKHLIAFQRSAATDPDTFQPMLCIADSVLAQASTTAFFVKAGMRAVAGYIGSNGTAPKIEGARINSPTFRRVGLPNIRPMNGQLLAGDDPNVMVIVDRPLDYPDIDTLSIEIINSGATPDAVALLWLETDVEPVPPGDTFWLRYTSTSSASALAWTPIVIDFEQLPEGEYIVCGMEHVSLTCLAARLVIPGSPWRPGTLGQNDLTNQNHAVFYDDRLGVFGRFNAFAPPTVEVLCTGTDSEHVGFLRVLRVK
ncbi:MAG: hypothetical protein H6747_14005 [Deltaproteobacteria bacterium]|nr:hypothetical protein [Deltaproteobacteria bacterium]